jgi:hypothetical protein
VVRTIATHHRYPVNTPKGQFPNSFEAADAYYRHYTTIRKWANKGLNGFPGITPRVRTLAASSIGGTGMNM